MEEKRIHLKTVCPYRQGTVSAVIVLPKTWTQLNEFTKTTEVELLMTKNGRELIVRKKMLDTSKAV